MENNENIEKNNNQKKYSKVSKIEKYVESTDRHITFTDMVYVFILCAILGWVVETIFVFLACGKLVNRGMTYGPYCSIYGLGGLILYIFFHNINPKKENIPFTFLSTAVIMGGFELLSGLFLKHVFGIEMWNYDNHFLSIMHYTTVPIMIGWGVLATIYVFFIQPLLLNIISKVPKNIIKRLALIIVFVYVLDYSFSLFNIYNNPELLLKMVNPNL